MCFFFKQKTAYEMRISDWSSDVCSSDLVDCKGTYGAACSSDLVTLVAPDFRSRATITWDSKPLTVQFGWKRIGSVRDSTAGSTGRIPAYDYFDLNLAVRPPVEGLTLAFGIDHLRSEEHTSAPQSLIRTPYAVFCLIKTLPIHRNQY